MSNVLSSGSRSVFAIGFGTSTVDARAQRADDLVHRLLAGKPLFADDALEHGAAEELLRQRTQPLLVVERGPRGHERRRHGRRLHGNRRARPVRRREQQRQREADTATTTNGTTNQRRRRFRIGR